MEDTKYSSDLASKHHLVANLYEFLPPPSAELSGNNKDRTTGFHLFCFGLVFFWQ